MQRLRPSCRPGSASTPPAAVDRQLDASAATTGVLLDTFMSAKIGPGLEIYTRPLVQRLGSGEWNRQVWLAAARYERNGAVGLRIEGGLIPAPIGLANLTLRPQLNPTISQPASLFQGLPPPEPFSPRVTLLGAIYPYGVSATVSGTKWDARAAVIDVVAAALAPHFRRHQSAPFRQRGGGRRRDADHRPAVRGIGDPRRLESRRRTARLHRDPRRDGRDRRNRVRVSATPSWQASTPATS